MNVASLENCKELFELSKWANSLKDLDNINIWGIDSEGKSAVITGQAYANNLEKIGIPTLVIPAYDLGYLLRKLTRIGIFVEITKAKNWRAGDSSATYQSIAAIPEDAACLLAIELFKAGVITTGEK